MCEFVWVSLWDKARVLGGVGLTPEAALNESIEDLTTEFRLKNQGYVTTYKEVTSLDEWFREYEVTLEVNGRKTKNDTLFMVKRNLR